MEKKLDVNSTRMLWEISNKPWRQHSTTQQLYGHLPPITKTIKIILTRHAGHCWRSRDELISDILQLTPSYGQAKAGRPARTYIPQISADTGYSLENLSGAMDDSDGWWEKVRKISASRAIWYIYIYIYIYIYMCVCVCVCVCVWLNNIDIICLRISVIARSSSCIDFMVSGRT